MIWGLIIGLLFLPFPQRLVYGLCKSKFTKESFILSKGGSIGTPSSLKDDVHHIDTDLDIVEADLETISDGEGRQATVAGLTDRGKGKQQAA